MTKLIRALMFGACGLTLTIATYLGGRSDGLREAKADTDEGKDLNDICKDAGIDLLTDDDEVGSDTM